MPWPVTSFVQHPYQGVNWIHPLKQRKIEELIEYTRKNYPCVTNIVVFGGSVREDCHIGSDIDIAIYEKGKQRTFCPPDNDCYDVLYLDELHPGSLLYAHVVEKGVAVYGDYIVR